jgi:hypothetical protein
MDIFGEIDSETQNNNFTETQATDPQLFDGDSVMSELDFSSDEEDSEEKKAPVLSQREILMSQHVEESDLMDVLPEKEMEKEQEEEGDDDNTSKASSVSAAEEEEADSEADDEEEKDETKEKEEEKQVNPVVLAEIEAVKRIEKGPSEAELRRRRLIEM